MITYCGGMSKMNNLEIQLANYQEELEMLSLRLKHLYNMVDTISIAFQHQHMEENVISCLESIGYSISGIKTDVDISIDRLTNIEE